MIYKLRHSDIIMTGAVCQYLNTPKKEIRHSQNVTCVLRYFRFGCVCTLTHTKNESKIIPMEYLYMTPQQIVKPRNKLQAVAFDFELMNEHQFRTVLSQKLGISESTLRKMWIEANAANHYYPYVKKVADYFGKKVEDLFLT